MTQDTTSSDATDQVEQRPARRAGGRPKLAEHERASAQIIARITDEQRATWDQIGGPEWLRAQLDLMRKTLDFAK